MIYTNLTEMWLGAGQTVLAYGEKHDSRVGDSWETLGYSGILNNINSNFVLNAIRKADPAYAAAEFLWYMSGDSSVDMLLAYAPSYSKFAETDGRAHGAYGPRIKEGLRSLLHCLREHPETRQAVLLIWRPLDIHVAHQVKDVPCTIALQFLLRGGLLHCVGYMRSNDVWLGLPYDVFCFTMLQRLIADELGVGYGQYHHHVGSMHLYEKNREDMQMAFEDGLLRPEQFSGHNWAHTTSLNEIENIVHMEANFRNGEDDNNFVADGSPATDLLIACTDRLAPSSDKTALHSPLLQTAWRLRYDSH